MPTLRNVNPLGQVDLPLIRRQGDPLGEHGTGCLEPGEEFDCSPEHARLLLAQVGNYEPVDADAQAIADELAAAHEAAQQSVEQVETDHVDQAADTGSEVQ